MISHEPTSVVLVVDTDQYSGNFEREMCAFLTGQVGECGVGDGESAEAAPSIRHLAWWAEHVVNEADDRGTMRPASIWQTPGWFNNGMGGHYRDDPAVYAEAAAAGAEAKREYLAKGLERSRRAQASGVASWQGVDLEDIAERNAADVERMRREAWRGPAYLSVAVFVDEVPPDDVMKEFRERAALFASERRHLFEGVPGEPLVIEGFRTIEPAPSLRP